MQRRRRLTRPPPNAPPLPRLPVAEATAAPAPGVHARFVVAPLTAERIRRYNRSRDPIIFDIGELLNLQIHFDAGAGEAYSLNNDALYLLILDTVMAMELPMRGVRVRVTLELSSRDNVQARTALGGQASLTLPTFSSFEDVYVSLETFMEYLIAMGYEGFSFDDIMITMSVEIRDLLYYYRTHRGGCAELYDGRHLSETEFGKTVNLKPGLSLVRYTSSTLPERSSIGLSLQKVSPRSIYGTKGLFLYGWDRTWDEPVCGIMSLIYAIECFSFRHGQANRCEYFERNPAALYEEALQRTRTLGIVGMTSHFQLGCLCEIWCPQARFVVMDASQKPLYMHNKTTDGETIERDGVPLETETVSETFYEAPFHPQKHPFLVDAVEEYWSNTVGVFFDHSHQHYVPIFDWKYFFTHISRKHTPFSTYSCFNMLARQQITNGVLSEELCHTEGCSSTVADPGGGAESDNETPASIPAKRRKRPFKGHGHFLLCPVCHTAVMYDQAKEHKCFTLRCYFCMDMFHDRDAFFAHVNGSLNTRSSRGGHKCTHCKIKLGNKECLQRHQLLCEGGPVTRKCHLCYDTIIPERPHLCHKRFCRECKRRQKNPIKMDYDKGELTVGYHRCPIAGKDSAKPNDAATWNELASKKVFVFDFESALESAGDDVMYPIGQGTSGTVPIYIHVVNRVGWARVPVDELYKAMALKTALPEPPHMGSYRQQVRLVNDLDAFWKDVVDESHGGDETFWYAHNLKGYDGRLLFDHLVANMIVPSHMLWQGGKMMQLAYPHPSGSGVIIFRDTLCHLTTSLEKLPGMFGLNTVCFTKGFYPYTFNTRANANYRGTIPDRSYFEVGKMAPQKRKRFETWYAEYLGPNGKEYRLNEETDLYCSQDVAILGAALIAYTRVCLETCGESPLRYITLASFVYDVFCTQHLPDNTLYYLSPSENDFARRALRGGLTNVRQLFYYQEPDPTNTTGLAYVDVVSLYPTAQFYDPVPVGRPKEMWYVDNDGNELMPQPDTDWLLNEFFGFAEVSIRPKRYIHHPLLCHFDTTSKRLLQSLEPLDRAVLTSVELQTALSEEGGYELLRVYRIHHYQRSVDVFKSYIRTWLVQKIKASSRPHNVDEFCAKLREQCGISLTHDDFDPNPSKRSMAKLCLNSLWGKFGQRETQVESDILYTAFDRFKFFRTVASGQNKLINREMIQGKVPLVRYQKLGESINKKNVAVASFVTANARIRLWKMLNILGQRVVYHDTDSIIYRITGNPDEFVVPTGELLGEWTEETPRLIHAFVGLAPKTYAYKYIDRDGQQVEVVKSKGFSLTKEVKRVLSFDNYVLLLASSLHNKHPTHYMQTCHRTNPNFFPDFTRPNVQLQTKLKTNQLVFRHERKAGFMVSFQGIKDLRFVYSKGFISYSTLLTYPYGTENFIDTLTSQGFDYPFPLVAFQPDAAAPSIPSSLLLGSSSSCDNNGDEEEVVADDVDMIF